MLSDLNKSIRDASENTLSLFLVEIKDILKKKENKQDVKMIQTYLIPSLIDILLLKRSDECRMVRKTVLIWINQFVEQLVMSSDAFTAKKDEKDSQSLLHARSGLIFATIIRGV